MEAIAQEYINLVESIFDRDPYQLSVTDYEFYLKIQKRNLQLSMNRVKEVNDFLNTEFENHGSVYKGL